MIGALGNEFVKTPTIDGLVEEGVAFTKAIVQSPICTPSQAELHDRLVAVSTIPEMETIRFRMVSLVARELIADSGYGCGLVESFIWLVQVTVLNRGWTMASPTETFAQQPRDDWPEGTHDYADWVREQGKDLDEMRG